MCDMIAIALVLFTAVQAKSYSLPVDTTAVRMEVTSTPDKLQDAIRG